MTIYCDKFKQLAVFGLIFYDQIFVIFSKEGRTFMENAHVKTFP